MWWVLALFVALLVLVGFVTWRKWIAPWRSITELIQQVGRGERPRTFLIADALGVQRAGVALEQISNRQRELEQESATRAAGQKAIFSALQDGLLVLDPERRIVLFNRAFQDTFGIDEHALDVPLLEALREPLLEQIVSEAAKNGAPARGEAMLAERHWQLDAAPMRHNGEQTGTVVLFHDITELKRVDEIRRDFVANVSHELRTPLSILRGYIETLLESGQRSRAELRRILGVMERHSKRLGVLLEDLLSLAKLESPNANLDFSNIRLDELCLNTVRDWEKQFAEKDLHVIVDLAPGLPAVLADASRLQEVLYNLLENAVRYSPKNGEIRLGVAQCDREIVLSVSDRGPGISERDLPRIFERFYRGDKSRSGNGGSGLGLAIVKHITQLHGGRVEAESQLGNGTTIRVILPAVTQT